jgi:hypothetical protein
MSRERFYDRCQPLRTSLGRLLLACPLAPRPPPDCTLAMLAGIGRPMLLMTRPAQTQPAATNWTCEFVAFRRLQHCPFAALRQGSRSSRLSTQEQIAHVPPKSICNAHPRSGAFTLRDLAPSNANGCIATVAGCAATDFDVAQIPQVGLRRIARIPCACWCHLPLYPAGPLQPEGPAQPG